MNIQINDKVGFTEKEVLSLVNHLIISRPPKENELNYGFETHGVFGITIGIKIPYPIQVYQSNKRKSKKSPIIIKIEKHTSI